MSVIDTLKGLLDKGKEAVEGNADKIHDAVDKAGGFIDEKTGGKYNEQIKKGTDAVKGAIPSDAQTPPAEPAPAEPVPPTAADPVAPTAAEPTPPAE